MDRVLSDTATGAFTVGNTMLVSFMVRGDTSGKMASSTMVSGNMEFGTAMAFGRAKILQKHT